MAILDSAREPFPGNLKAGGLVEAKRAEWRNPITAGSERAEETTMLKKLHHVAYRCRNARETVDFYSRLLGMPFAHAILNERVPSLQEPSPHLHIFFEMEDGSYIAFFELAGAVDDIGDPNTPKWVQHLALEVANVDTLIAAKRRLEAAGIEVVGPTDHGFCQSIYFFDPSGHRLEMTARTEHPGELERFRREAPEVLEAWARRTAAAKQEPVR